MSGMLIKRNIRVAIIGQGRVGVAFKELVSTHYGCTTYDPLFDELYPTKKIDEADFVVICVPTPLDADGACDVSIVEDVISGLSNKHILIKSTVSPGTTDYLSEKYRKNICFSPEYIGESSYHNSYYNEMIDTPFIIIGGDQEEVNFYFEIFEPIFGPEAKYYACSKTEAEIIKYMENSFFATKVTFVNEFYQIASTFGADWYRIREGWLLDKRINRTFTSVFADNKGFSGKCLPKDISSIIESSKKQGYNPELLQAVVDVNEKLKRENL